ncbi:unnamed protein product [Diatraea saccharalis]|uniref:Uncharacterized protein n=1 Tax=Diatraea saccharalis TaxID=40085 RepID=A0A9N9WIK7_9NEOP|nr:unnamed protein product [Diatraea saccharalis]
MTDHKEVPVVETQLMSEYKDGQLQIVEVRPFEKDVMLESEVVNSMSGLETDSETKYIQLVNTGDKSMMQLDLLNLTLIKCADGTESYRLVANGEGVNDGETTVTCVLASSDNEGNDDSEGQESYMVMNNEQNTVMYLQSELPTGAAPLIGTEPGTVMTLVDTSKPVNTSPVATTTDASKQVPKLTPVEILERAKALQKALLGKSGSYVRRKRKSDLPPPHELLSAPNFKLFLYSCKSCNFKCNAIKEMTAHKGGAGAAGRGARRGTDRITLQCARCPYKGNTHMQLMKHVKYTADVLVCGACGFESASRLVFKKHIEQEHGATAV